MNHLLGGKMMTVPLVAFLVGVNISVLYKVKCSNFSGREILSAEMENLMHSHPAPHEPWDEQLQSSPLWS